MKNYRDLLITLMRVIIQYHNEKKPLAKVNEQDTIDNLLEIEHAETMAKLYALVNTLDKDDKTRTPLLMYILYGIDQLKHLDNNITEIDTQAVSLINHNISELVMNLKHLLETRQSIEFTVHYNNKSVKLIGLLTFFNQYCISGNILQKILFAPLEIEPHTKNSMIQQIVTNLIELSFYKIDHQKLKQKQQYLFDRIEALERQVINLHNEPLFDDVNAIITHQPHLAHPRQALRPNFRNPSFFPVPSLSELTGFFFRAQNQEDATASSPL